MPNTNLNEQRYRVLIDNAPEVVLIFDVELGRFIDANQSAIDLFQFSREELFQLGPSDISPTLYQGMSAADKAREYIQQALDGGNPAFEWVHVDRDGHEIPCEIRLIRFPPYDRLIVRASIIDLTDKKKIETKLAESEERLKLAIRATGLGCYDWYPQENKLHWDAGMHELFGLEPSSSIDRNEHFTQCIHPDDLEQVTANFQTYLDANEGELLTFEDEYRIMLGGKVAHMLSIGEIVRAENGEVQRIIGTVQDITERIRTSAQIQHQATLLNKVSDAVIETDASYVIRSWNKGAEKMYGWTAEEAIGQILGTLVPITYLKESQEEVRTRFLNDGYWNGEVIQQNRAGDELYVLSSVTVLKNAQEGMVGSIGVNRDISYRRQAELALRESEAHYRSLVEYFPNGVIALFDQDLRYTLMNGEGISQLGLDSTEIIGQRLRDLYSEEIYERDEPYQVATLQGEKSTRIVPVDNSYYSVTTLPVRDEVGNIVAGLEVSQDITALVETEKKLNKTLEQLQLAIQTAELGIWQHVLATDQLETNDRLLEIYGADPTGEGLSRESWRDQVHPDDKEQVQQDLAKLSQGNHLAKSVFRAILPDGEIRHIQAAARPIFDQEGKLVELIGINIDITSIKKNEEALREREAFHRAIFENSLNAVLVTDDAGQLRSFNQAACDILGFEEEELRAKNLTDLPISNVPDKKQWYQDILQKGKDAGELSFSLPAGDIRVTQFYVVHIGEDFNLCVFVDITDRKKAGAALKESEEKFSKSFHENPTPMMVVEFSSKTIVDVNKAYTRMTGYQRDEVIHIPNKLGFQIVDTSEKSAIDEVLEAAKTFDRVSNLEFKIVSKTGKQLSLIAYAEPIDIQNQHLHIVTILDITERKMMENALRQAKDYAESLIDTANVIVVGLDELGVISTFNQAAHEITGYTREELGGENWFETLVPRDRYPEVWDEFSQLEKEGKVARTFENPILTKNGEERIISWQNSVLYDQGEPVGTLSFGVDITERKEMEETMRDREERFRTVFNQQFQFMAILSPEGRFLEVNDLSLQVVGVTHTEVLGRFFWEAPAWAKLPQWQVIIKDLIFQAAQSQETLLAEIAFSTTNGEERWADTSFTAILNADGELKYILVQASDITERKLAQEHLLQAQQELSELANRFRISTRAARIGIWDWDIKKDQLIWDETMLEIYGISRKQFTDRMQYWQQHLHPEDLDLFQEVIRWSSTGQQELLNTEFRIQRGDGAIRHIKAVGSVQRDEQGQVVRIIGTNWDITQEKEAEQQKIRARQLELRNRELEQFAYVASHDLQEPLRTVISFVGLLKRGYQDRLDERANEYLQFVVEASSRMSQLIKGLLEYSRIGTNRELTLVDSAALVQHILKDLSAQISSTQAVIKVDPLPQIKGYETELRMLFQNLISNAVKFRKPDQHPHIHIGVKDDKKNWIYSVKDDGIGIAPMYREQIFALFQRLHGREEYEGTGIGLAHCQKIVDLHGGTIWVESQLHQGSTFFFSIAKSEKELD